MFWLPNAAQHRVRGGLTASFDGIGLELEGVLGVAESEDVDAFSLMLDAPDHYELIHGSADGPVTLEDCTTVNSGGTLAMRSFHADGSPAGAFSMPHQEVRAMRAVLGVYLRRFELTGLRLQLTHLAQWAGVPNGDVTPLEGGGTRMEYRPPVPVVATIDGARVSIEWTAGATWGSSGRMALEPGVAFVVELPAPMSLTDALRQFVTPLQAFMTLATSTANAVTHLHIRPSPAALLSAEQPGAGHLWPCFYPAKGRRGVVVEQLAHDEPFFRLSEVRDRFGDVLSRWFETIGQFGPAVNLYVAQLHSPPEHLELRFLLAAMTAEVLHARLNIGRGRMSLHRRMLELVQNMPPSSAVIIGSSDIFAALVARTRNYYTHWDDPADVASGGNLLVLTEKVRLVTQATLLHELGFSADELDQVISRNRATATIAALQQ